MKLILPIFALLLATPALAQQADLPAGVSLWPKGVPPAGITHKDDFKDHVLSISHRETSGKVEVHEHKADVMVIQSGEATLVVGGQGVGMHSTGPGELQGTSITGGASRHVGPGDVIHIPANMPHQFLLAPGAQITYVLVKILNQ